MENKDVVIIGAGVIGVCSAYYLHKSGRKVTVIDSLPESDQDGCSFINCGYISPSHFVPLAAPGVLTQGLKWMFNSTSPLYIKPRLDADLLRWLWLFARSSRTDQDRKSKLLLDLNLESRSLYADLAQSHGFEIGKQDKGLLMLCKSEKALHHEESIAEMSRSLGLGAEMKTREEIHAMEPDFLPNVVGGVYFPDDAHLSPMNFVNSMRAYLKEEGVEFLWDSKILAMHANEEMPSLTLKDTSISAKDVVLAGGSWSAQLAKSVGLKLPLQAGKGYSLTVPNPAKKLHHPAILIEAKVALTPMRNAMRFGGTMEINGLNSSINTARVDTIKAKSQAYLNGVDDSWFENIRPQFGFRPVSPDGLPYIGKHPQNKRITLACGHAMLGLSMGPITGKLVADILQEKTSTYSMDLLNPGRFS
jgi:D-amino-acid dehydrogenase